MGVGDKKSWKIPEAVTLELALKDKLMLAQQRIREEQECI